MTELDLRVERHPSTLRLLVEDKLRAAIVDGRFPPGRRLVERELCELTGVGRTSIREAIRQLEAEGLVTVVPHRGPSVTVITPDEARDLYAVRGLLEGYAGREFARLRPEAEIAALGRDVEGFAQAAAGEDRPALIAAKTALYATLMRGCGNGVVWQMLTTLHNRVTLLRLTSMSQPGRLKDSVSEIRTIAAAIVTGDGNAAEAACRLHIARAAVVAIAVLERQADVPARAGPRRRAGSGMTPQGRPTGSNGAVS